MNERDGKLETADKALSELSAGRVLDVATGGGGFITYLVETLKDYTQITGIDANESRLEVARKAHPQDNIHFQCMDATRMEFPDNHFDTVCMANSMHHMAQLADVLSEMMRVCKPGGTIIISETYRDGQSETQLSNVLLHDWWAAVDTAEGITHHSTFTRQQLFELIEKAELHQRKYYEESDLDSDPMNPDLIKELDEIIDRFIQRSITLNEGEELCQRGEQLRQRVHQVGFHGATSLIMIGEK